MSISKSDKDTKHKKEHKDPRVHCPPEDDEKNDPTPPRRRKPRVRFDLCGTPPATPYLVIRSFTEDLGVRPVPADDAGGLAYSPDIPFIPEVTPDGSIVLQCWITNIGLGPAAPVQIEFFLLPPSITSPGPDPVLVATEHAIISPHMSKLIKTRPLSFLNPFGGGLAQGVMVRCSTPFDRHFGGLDPVQDRHVAVMNAWPITDQGPDVSLGLSNLTSRPSTAKVEMLIQKVRHRSGSQPTAAVRSRFSGQDVLEIGERSLKAAEHINSSSDLKERHRKAFRRVLNGQRPERAPKASIQSSAGANQLKVEALVDETPRKLFPTAEYVRRKSEGGHECGLPSGRRTLVEGIELGAFEERTLKLKVTPTEPLRVDEYFTVHLFHTDEAENLLRGRVCLVVGKTPPTS